LGKSCEGFSYTGLSAASKQGLRTIEGLCERIQREGVTSLVDQLSSLKESVVGGLETAATSLETAASSATDVVREIRSRPL